MVIVYNNNDVIMTWTNLDDCAARAMCLVITLTHVNYKLLVYVTEYIQDHK